MSGGWSRGDTAHGEVLPPILIHQESAPVSFSTGHLKVSAQPQRSQVTCVKLMRRTHQHS